MSALANGECAPGSPSAARFPDRVALAMSSVRSASPTSDSPRNPEPDAPRVGHWGNGLLRQASSRTICCGAGDEASNSCSSATDLSAVLAFDLHIGRREHVLAVDLHAMARVINECHFGASRLALEFLQGIEKIGAIPRPRSRAT